MELDVTRVKRIVGSILMGLLLLISAFIFAPFIVIVTILSWLVLKILIRFL